MHVQVVISSSLGGRTHPEPIITRVVSGIHVTDFSIDKFITTKLKKLPIFTWNHNLPVHYTKQLHDSSHSVQRVG